MSKDVLADRAKVGTSSCKGCKEKIEKGTLRLAHLVELNPEWGSAKHYFHLHCWKPLETAQTLDHVELVALPDEDQSLVQQALLGQTPGHKQASASPAKAKAPPKKRKLVRAHEEDDDDSQDSEFEDDEEVVEVARPKKAGKKQSGAESQRVRSRKGTEIEFTPLEGAEGEDVKLTKKALAEQRKRARLERTFAIAPPQAGAEPVQVPADDPAALRLSKMSVDQLKDILRANKQTLTGTKDELVARCLDGEVNGALQVCPMCRQGKLRFDVESAQYWCSGFFDKDINQFMKCGFKAVEAARGQWVQEASDEPASASAAVQTAATPAAASSAAVTLPEGVAEKVQALHGNPKEAATLLCEALRAQHVSLPADERAARLKVGGYLMTFRNEDAFDLDSTLKTVVAEFPVKVPGQAAPADESSVKAKVEANNSICAMFSELAKLERLAGGEHAGFKASSWKKAALAIAGLDFEVTDAKVLTAAKTKVANIGKGSAGVIDEFLQSGKTGLVKLEELRAKVHGG